MESYKRVEITPRSEKAGSIMNEPQLSSLYNSSKKKDQLCWLLNNKGFQTALRGQTEDKPRYVMILSGKQAQSVLSSVAMCLCAIVEAVCVASVTAEQIISYYKLSSKVQPSPSITAEGWKALQSDPCSAKNNLLSPVQAL